MVIRLIKKKGVRSFWLRPPFFHEVLVTNKKNVYTQSGELHIQLLAGPFAK